MHTPLKFRNGGRIRNISGSGTVRIVAGYSQTIFFGGQIKNEMDP
jgi:hypothetical protein